MRYLIFEDEKYKCPYCDKFYYDRTELIENKWKCIHCNMGIHISVQNLGTGYIMERKLPFEVKRYDSIHLPGLHDIFEVYGVEYNDKKNKINIKIKNIGSRDFQVTDFVNVVVGRYHEKDWKDYGTEI